MRIANLGGGLLLAAAFLTGCGGGDAPADASEEDFCESYNGLYDHLGDIASGDTKAAIEGMKDWADGIAEVGTPAGIPDEAREGFDLLVDAIQDVDADASAEELEQVGEDMGKEGEQKIDAFSAWATETCPMPIPDMGELEDEMSDLESDLESELSESP